MSKPRDELALWAYAAFGADLVPEHRFHETRRWRIDFAVPRLKLGIEYDGYVGTGGRPNGHTTISGRLADDEKRGTAAAMGWTIFVANAKNVEDGSLYQLIDMWLDRQADAAFGSRNVREEQM